MVVVELMMIMERPAYPLKAKPKRFEGSWRRQPETDISSKEESKKSAIPFGTGNVLMNEAVSIGNSRVRHSGP